MSTTILILAALAAQPAAPLLAPPDPPCAEADRRLPEALAGWDRPAVPASGAIVPGRPVRVVLEEASRVGFARPPERAPAAGTRGAAVPIDVPAAGRYRIALSGPAWIDLVVEMEPVTSAEHGHGPRCSTIRKLVSFDLPAGRHLVQLSGTTAREMVLMLVPPPAAGE